MVLDTLVAERGTRFERLARTSVESGSRFRYKNLKLCVESDSRFRYKSLK